MRKATLPILILIVLSYPATINITNSTEYQQAVSGSRPGDTLLLKSGTSFGGVGSISTDGTAQAPIVMKGAGPGASIVNTTGDGMNLYGAHWIFEDIRFNGNGGTLILHPKPGCGDYITVRNCFFYNCHYKAIKIDGYADYFLLENSSMFVGEAGLMNNDGSDYLTCRNNYTYGFKDVGGAVNYIFFSKAGLAYTVFENNLVVGGKRGLVSFGGGSMGLSVFRHDNDLASAYPNGTIETIRSIARNNICIGGEGGISSSTTLDCEAYNNTIIDCAAGLWVERHHGDPFGLKFYNNLLIRTSKVVENDGATVTKSHNTVLNVDPSAVFMDYNTFNYFLSDFRIKPSMAAQVGTGRAPIDHADWPAFHGLPTTQFYDYYGTIRANTPIIGATEIYSEDAIDRLPSATLNRDMVLKINPNPTYGRAALTLLLKRDRGLVDIYVRDIRGRHLRTVYYGPMKMGTQTVSWDGRDHQGFALPSGVYIFRVSLGKEVLFKKVQLVR